MSDATGQRPDGGVTQNLPPEDRRVFALVGNPNCGKTTLFNALTGMRQKVGNYPGVTVERKEGTCISQHGKELLVIDLPGAYSLNARSPDEEVLRDVLLGRRPDTPRPDVVICVIDASNPERNLYLASQVLELGLPVIVALNMTDIAEARDLRVDARAMGEALGVPVVPMRANTREGIPELRIAMSRHDLPVSHHKVDLPADVASLLERFGHGDNRAALYLLDEEAAHEHADADWQNRLIADRYEAIGKVCERAVGEPAAGPTPTDRLDALLLHKVWGWAALVAILGSLFVLIFSVANVPMGWIEAAFAAAGDGVRAAMPEGDLRDLITDGMLAGVEGVVIFLPQILILFFFLGLMEDTGYMSRVAFIMDRLMSKVGLSGKSTVPLLGSYACAIPGVMGARTIPGAKDRLITILVAPFASCTARLPVYILMIGLLVPGGEIPALTKAGYLLGLYALGTLGIFAFAGLFNRVLKRAGNSPPIMELPGYKAPSWKSILLHMWDRSYVFVRRAGTIILGISIILWALQTYPKSGADDPATHAEQSYAGQIGRAIEPAIEPLGFDAKIGVGLVASFAAREVFVSAMSIAYSVDEEGDDAGEELRDKLRGAKRDDGSPVFTPLTCLSLLVFFVFALQCMSTVAVVRRETNSWRWAIFQLAYMTGFAYLASLAVYQGGRLLGFS